MGGWFEDLRGNRRSDRRTPQLTQPDCLAMSRVGKIERETAETEISLEVNLDGTGQAQVDTGIGFLDHMLDLLTRHAVFDLDVRAQGDLHVDQHHTVEDVGICLDRRFARHLVTSPAFADTAISRSPWRKH